MNREEKDTWKITIRYDGARYKGWQRLGADANGDTIQGKIEAVMATLCGEDVLVTGSGRTDAGVHALAQVAHFRSHCVLTAEEILSHANRYLPDDIAIVDAQKEDDRFHARYKVLEKHYLYQLDIGSWPEPFQRKYAWHVGPHLDLDAMNRAIPLLLGTHDFSAFTSMKSKKKSAVRTINEIRIESPGDHSSLVSLHFVANGFLHNMVRILVGTLVEVGLGERSVQSVQQCLDSLDRSSSGARAPAKGLFLEKTVY